MRSAEPFVPAKDALQSLVDGVETLVHQHLALARVELTGELRALGREAAAGAAGLLQVAAGYLLLMAALSLGLSAWIPGWAAFGLVALVNLTAGGALATRRARQLELLRRAGGR
jgi:hypothetical protein